MTSIKPLVDELNSLIVQFRFEEALDKFYAEDIISVENENPPTVGLPAYRIGAKKYLSDISNNKAELKDMIICGDLCVCQWHYVFDHKAWGHWDKDQLSVQRWKDGKIVHERHYYD